MTAQEQPNLLFPEGESRKKQETFTIQEAADVLNVDAAYLVQLLDAHKLPSAGEGKHQSISRDDLLFTSRRATFSDGYISATPHGSAWKRGWTTRTKVSSLRTRNNGARARIFRPP